jgi:DNA repair protein RecO (recombination protein O)
MPTIKDQAVCLRRWDFSETSQTVSLLLREHGVVRGLAKGAKRERGRFSGGIDVLTAGEVVAITKPGRQLATLTDWNLRTSWTVVRRDLAANRIGLYAVDLAHQMLAEHDGHPRLFDALIDLLDALQAGDDKWTALLRFQWVLLSETGYTPQLERFADTDQAAPSGTPTLGFSAAAGGIVEDTGGADRWRVRTATIELIRQIARGKADTLASDEANLQRANRLLAAYIREVIGDEPPAMHWLFPDLGTRVAEGARPRRRTPKR